MLKKRKAIILLSALLVVIAVIVAAILIRFADNGSDKDKPKVDSSSDVSKNDDSADADNLDSSDTDFGDFEDDIAAGNGNTAVKKDKAFLTSISVDGEPISGFDKDTLNYEVFVEVGLPSPPTVTAIKSDGVGAVKIIQASKLSEKATVSLNGVTYAVKFTQRDDSTVLNNTYYKLSVEKKLRVAYLGGSVTYGFGASNPDMYSWRALTTKWLQRKYPDADITETNAGIGGTGSSYGLYRAVSDLKLNSKTEKPDLVFIEFAINDLYDGLDEAAAGANVEGIIRTVYSYAPDADIIIVLVTDQGRTNTAYSTYLAHQRIADKYKIPWINVGAMLWDDMVELSDGAYPTDSVYRNHFADGVHPANGGYTKYSEYITELLSKNMNKYKPIPAGTVNSYIPSDAAAIPDSPRMANLKGQGGAAGIRVDENGYITANSSGAGFKFKFKGTELMLWAWSSPQSGKLSVKIDNGEEIIVDLCRQETNNTLSKLAYGLADKEHTVTVKLLSGTMDLRYFLIGGGNTSSGITLIK